VEPAAQPGVIASPEQDPAASPAAPAGGPGAAFRRPDRASRRWGRAGAVVRAIRPLHWAKNLLVFVPLFEGHHGDVAATIPRALVTFAAFCLCASSAYVVNDLLDVREDRGHPRKRRRPFAAGELGPDEGLRLAAVLAALGLGAASFASTAVLVVLGVYWVGTLAYSLLFRQVVLLDVFFLAGFFTLRLLAGALAEGEPTNPWLFAVSTFAFLSLGWLKRTAELRAQAGRGAGALRPHRDPHLRVLALAGKASGALAVVASAGFISSRYAAELYASPARLHALLPLAAFWLARMWWLADRGRVDEDPVRFVLGDRVSLVFGVAAAAITWLSL